MKFCIISFAYLIFQERLKIGNIVHKNGCLFVSSKTGEVFRNFVWRCSSGHTQIREQTPACQVGTIWSAHSFSGGEFLRGESISSLGFSTQNQPKVPSYCFFYHKLYKCRSILHTFFLLHTYI